MAIFKTGSESLNMGRVCSVPIDIQCCHVTGKLENLENLEKDKSKILTMGNLEKRQILTFSRFFKVSAQHLT